MNSDLYVFGLILIGIWFGCGLAGVVLIWKRNVSEAIWWKLFASLITVTQGPFNLRAIT